MERLIEFLVDIKKVYEEWIYVDMNKIIYEVNENLFFLSLVYGKD